MGLFSKATKSVTKATAQTFTAKNVVKAAVFGATAPFEYTVVKPAEILLPKVLSLAGRTASVGSQALAGVKGIVAANPELLSAGMGLLNGGGLGSLLGGTPATDASVGAATPFASAPADAGIPLWVWIAGGAAALLGLVLFLRRKAA